MHLASIISISTLMNPIMSDIEEASKGPNTSEVQFLLIV